jgi:hypothetical protein
MGHIADIHQLLPQLPLAAMAERRQGVKRLRRAVR